MTAAAKAKSGTHWRRIIALTLFAGLMLAALALANSGRAAIETPPPPSVWSDKADYAPGEQVALSGANWAPGESVHIRVNDDAGETWRRDVDVVADANGAISDQFNLPDWFVAQYSVTATGASSGTATWTFTDGNVTLHLEAAQGVANMTVTYDRWNGTSSSPNSTCSGTPTNTNLTVTIPTASGTVNITGFGGNTDSVRLKSVTTTTTTKTFDRWTSAVGTTGSAKNTDSGVDVPGTPTPCISNDNGGSSGNLTDAFAHFKNANAAPVCTNGSATTPEDTAVAANLNCTDADGNPLTYTIVSGPTSGVLSGSGASRTYTPNANFNGTDSFTFKANDGTVDSNVATFNLTITEVNDAPTAVADSKSVAEDGVLTFAASTLTTNDSRGPANESGQTLTVTAVSSTASTHGSVSLSAGTVTYTPDADYNGAASFSYTVQDNGTTNGAADPKTATGTVNITVTEVNDAPDAVDDSASVAEDGNTLVDVLGNDSTGPANESGQALTITDVSTPAHGTAVVQSGKVKYTPNADYNGSDSFTYTATDNGTTNGANDFKSDTAMVSVTVTEVNDDPTAVADSKSVAEDGSLSFPASDLTANDSAGPANESGQTLTVISVDPITGQTHGSVSLVAGTITYTPDPDFNGLAKFDYTVQDNGTTDGAPDFKTGTVYVNVTVTEVNDAPTATDDSKTVAEDGTLAFPASDLTANDSAGPANESGQTLTVTAVGSATHGSVSLVAGTITYTPDADYNGPASFHYTARDNGTTNGAADPLEDEGTVDITITEVNDAPDAANDSASVAEDNSTGTLVDVLANDSVGPANESSQSLTITAVGTPAHGTAAVESGKIRYIPTEADYNGTDSFTYTVTDNGTTAGEDDFKSDTATVNVTVTEVNDDPTAVDDSATVAEDANVLVDVLANDSKGPANEFGQTLTITAVSTPAHGSAVVQSGQVKYTPDADYNGSDSFTYTATDNGTTSGVNDFKSDTATVSVTVTDVNDRPVAAADSLTVAEDGSVTVGTATLTANDSPGPANESGQTLTITAVGSETHGSVSLNGTTGEVIFTPDGDYNGPGSFTYTVRDNGTTSGSPDYKTDTGTVNVTVTEVNDAPHAVNDSASVAEDSSTGVLVDVLANDGKGAANESGQTLTITFVGTPSHGTAMLESGKIRYTPTESNYNGPDSFGYTITDNGTTNGVADPKSDSAMVNITVTPVNDKPSVARNNASVTVNEASTGVVVRAVCGPYASVSTPYGPGAEGSDAASWATPAAGTVTCSSDID